MIARFDSTAARTCVVLCTLAGLTIAGSATAAGRKTLPGHVPAAVSALRPRAELARGTNLDLTLGLALRNREGLTNLLVELYSPSSTNYHRYLSSKEFTVRFGPSEADYQKVIAFARANGLAITGQHANRVLLDVRGPVNNIEKAFHTTLKVYPHPTEPRTFYAPAVEPSVPAEIPIQDLSGLDNFQLPRPLDLRRNGNDSTNSIVSNATGSGPGGTFMGKDFRAAYAPGVTNDGAGQVIGLFEFGPYYTNDIYQYETNAGLPTSIVISNILLNGVSGVPSGSSADDGEEALDIDMAISMAPGATVLVYEGNNGNDIFNRMATDNLAKQMSCSFGYSPMPASTEQIFQQYAAQGQSMFVASGDGGAYPTASGAIMPQAEDPYLTIVGGTSLTTSGAGGRWISETTWGGSGGGISTRWGIPSWQAGLNMQSNQGSPALRNIPDVAMLADTVIFWIFKNGQTGTVGGTSAAAPLWAGFTALVNQEAAKTGKQPVGFLNPAIYALGKSSGGLYRAAFHDITTGNNHGYNAVSGFDLCTGWGSPTGSNTISALLATGTNDFVLYATPGLSRFVPGSSGATRVSVLRVNDFAGAVDFSLSDLPPGVMATFDPPSTSGETVLTVTTSSETVPREYTANILGTSSGITHSFPLALSVQAGTPEQVPVSLSGRFNRSGIYSDGNQFGGGADGVGFAYSATLLGAAPSWNRLLFSRGPANAANLVSCAGQILTLPAGQFTTLEILGAAVNGNQANQTFTVTYSDNTTSSYSQSLSDWARPNNYSGETVALALPYRNSSDGARDANTAVSVYGYSLPLNPEKSVKSLKLPGNGNVLILAMTLAASPAPVTLTSVYNRIGIYADGTTFASNGGLDGGGTAYSAAWLGGAHEWNNTVFHFGPANGSNSISCAGQTLQLPAGKYAALRMLATGVQGNQVGQSFVLVYDDLSTTTISQSLSDWFTPQNYAGESKAVITGYRNLSTGGKENRAFYLYGYSIPVNSAKTLQSIRLPNNANVELLAMSLVPDWPPVFLADPIHLADLEVGQPILGSVSQHVVDQNGDPVVFAKVSGPDWLSVSSNGGLSGAPGSSDQGTNSFVVSATDPGGLSATGALVIQVRAASAIEVGIELQGADTVMTWSGGTGPYQLQFANDLKTPQWQPLGPLLSTNRVMLPRTNTAAFYRILQQ